MSCITYRTDYRDSVGIGLGILSLLPEHNIDSNGTIWLLGLAVVLLAISRIAEMGNKARQLISPKHGTEEAAPEALP